jgi:hypothetical protein
MVFADHVAQGIAQGAGPFSQSDPACDIDHAHVTNLSRA